MSDMLIHRVRNYMDEYFDGAIEDNKLIASYRESIQELILWNINEKIYDLIKKHPIKTIIFQDIKDDAPYQDFFLNLFNQEFIDGSVKSVEHIGCNEYVKSVEHAGCDECVENVIHNTEIDLTNNPPISSIHMSKCDPAFIHAAFVAIKKTNINKLFIKDTTLVFNDSYDDVYFKELETLSITYCRLQMVPPFVKYLMHLTRLILSNNEIRFIPRYLANCPLKTLSMHRNNILPDRIPYFVDNIPDTDVRSNMNALRRESTFVDETHTLHNRTIKNSTSDSIQKFIKNNPTDMTMDEVLDEMKVHDHVWESTIDEIMIRWFDRIDEDFDVSIKQLLPPVWIYIKYDSDLVEIFNNQLADARGNCLNGFLGRVIGCLDGIEPDVEISISVREQLLHIFQATYVIDKQGNHDIERHYQIFLNRVSDYDFSDYELRSWIDEFETQIMDLNANLNDKKEIEEKIANSSAN